MFSYLRKHNSILKNEIQDVSHNISWMKSSIITYYFNFSNFYTSISYIDFFLNILCYFYNIFYNYLCKIEGIADREDQKIIVPTIVKMN